MEAKAPQDHYQTLGVARSAPADEIKKAYRKLARKHHPDISKAPDAHVRMAAVNEAHEALSNPESRAAYDEQLSRPPPQPGDGRGFRASARGKPGAGFEFFTAGDEGVADSDGGDAARSDFFEQVFGRGRAGGRRGPPAAERGADQTAPIELDLLDAYQGAERSFTLSSPQTVDDGRPRNSQRTLQVRIPRGIRAGQQIRLAGSGSPGLNGGPAGDLLLAVSFKADPRWRTEGRNVVQRVPLAPWEAALGATASIHTPGGEAEVHFPAGWQPGRKLRLKGRGIPGAGTQEAGHLYLELELALPAADSEAQRAAYSALAAAFPDYAPRAGSVR
jgi:curved DNA-binding protein